MKVSIKAFLFFSSMIILLLTGCGSGSNGGSGSAGPAGPQGPAGPSGTSLHVVDANGKDMGILVNEDNVYYKVYNTTANIFFEVLKRTGTVFSTTYYTSSNCTDSGTVYINATYGYTTNDLIVDNAGNCFSITTTTPETISVSSNLTISDIQQISCDSFGAPSSRDVYPANQITCPIPTQYAAPVSVKVE
jgi:hypothetical protein